ncbi:GIY-YIG nuclease family protein [Alkalicaulis satelles]|uniref:GIY-YIG nuclease family protein n=1 Tax=Alkalicaulis satelles TaxID=2609175 RepID=UPI0022B927E0|nr:GIY-YIG nuclease family protein [Alkalicaulis satelles]
MYLMASRRNGTLYCGSTSSPVRRIWQHREGMGSVFTRKYRVNRLVWYEFHGQMSAALKRELQIKEWRRRWKLELIETANPDWRDLYEDWF